MQQKDFQIIDRSGRSADNVCRSDFPLAGKQQLMTVTWMKIRLGASTNDEAGRSSCEPLPQADNGYNEKLRQSGTAN